MSFWLHKVTLINRACSILKEFKRERKKEREAKRKEKKNEENQTPGFSGFCTILWNWHKDHNVYVIIDCFFKWRQYKGTTLHIVTWCSSVHVNLVNYEEQNETLKLNFIKFHYSPITLQCKNPYVPGRDSLAFCGKIRQKCKILYKNQ